MKPKYIINVSFSQDDENTGLLSEDAFNFSTKGDYWLLSTDNYQVKKEDFKNVKSLEDRFDESDRERLYVIVESVMCKKTKNDLQDLFGKVQFYIISKNLKEIRDISSRPFFKGSLSTDSNQEFNIRFKKGWSDKFQRGDIDIDKYLDSLS